MWSVPRMWEGQTCAVLASGDSMRQQVADVVRASGCKTIAICRTVELAPWADMVYAADEIWWRMYRNSLKHFKGLKVTCDQHQNVFPEVLKLKTGASQGFDPNPNTVCTGGNSGYQGVHIAAHAGCKRILLCGFDMQGAHWHREYKAPFKTHAPENLQDWAVRFNSLKEPLEERGIEVLNCTPGSALKTWPYMELEKALALDMVA